MDAVRLDEAYGSCLDPETKKRWAEERMNRRFHYAWIILFSTFFALLAVQGARLSFGAFITPWEAEFALDRGTVSLISMVSFLVYGISQPIVGNLVDRFGARAVLAFSAFLIGVSMLLTSLVTSPWQLFLLYGVLASIGVGGVSNVATSVVVANWFRHKRGVAFGMMEAGVGAGQMLLVPFSLFFIEWFGWKWTVILLGLFLVLVVLPVIVLLLRDRPSDMGMLPLGGEPGENSGTVAADTAFESVEKENGVRAQNVVRDRTFWFVLLPFFVCGMTTTGLMDTHLIPFAHDHGFSTEVTGAAVSLLAGFNIAGILLSGMIADRWSSRKLLAFLYAARAVSLVILLYSHEPVVLLLFAALFGLVDFATVAPTQMLITQYFRGHSVGQILGWLFFSHQVGSALGAYIPGLLHHHTGGYALSFVASIVLLVAASVVNLILPEPDRDVKENVCAEIKASG